ncbi:MAG: translation initiation factor IF-2 [Bacteroidales bacterium]
MTEGTKTRRLSKVAREFNIGLTTIVDFLSKKGITVNNNPNAKISQEAYELLFQEFQSEKTLKEATRKAGLNIMKRESISIDKDEEAAKEEKEESKEEEYAGDELMIKGAEDAPVDKKQKAEEPPAEDKGEKKEAEEKPDIKEESEEESRATGPKVLGKLDMEELKGRPPVQEEEPAPDAGDTDQKEEEEKPPAVAEKEETPAEKEETEKPADTDTETEAPAAAEDDESVGEEADKGPKVLGKIDLEEKKPVKKKKAAKKADTKTAETSGEKSSKPEEKPEEKREEKAEEKAEEKKSDGKKAIEKPAEPTKDHYQTQFKKLEGPTILGKMDLPEKKETEKKPVASSSDPGKAKKRKRKRIKKDKPAETPATTPQDKKGRQDTQKARKKGKAQPKPEVTEEEISRQIRETLANLSGSGKSKAAKHRRMKRDILQQQKEKEQQQEASEGKTLEVTEFISAAELASLMDVSVNEVISTCMSLGLFVSINQRLDAETITIVADEFGYEVDFVSADSQQAIEEEEDDPADLRDRAPIVTVMGHVDHGKTSLLDHIRHANVIAGEAGGITQHIGAYAVEIDSGKTITFLDTPGHEAFTAMRARGAKVTDVAIIVVAADDSVMPQTVEAINHAQAAGVPIVIAINKIDKENANPERVKEELANMNILVEDWGGKFQSQEISAKEGLNTESLLEKVLLEAEMLELKANPARRASGTVIESSLDRGRGYVSTILVQNGTLQVGDLVVAGITHGKVKAMFNERGHRIDKAGPATPVLILGLDGAPQAGDLFNVMETESEAKNITNKRQQLIREQGLRTQKHITLDEIGRRIAIGDFKELNVIVKGDVDGSVEALSDSILKLSTEEIQVNIIHKAVGQITEGDVLLASASNAIIIGFQVRPSMTARKLAEQEQIDIRLYSVIYNATNELKSAIEGMLSPEIEEKVVANLEVRDVFKITKVGTVAGCMVMDGKIHRNSDVRLIRDGIVVYTGKLGSLKRYKDDVKEVSAGYECGLNIDRFNDIKVGDIIEAFETFEVARKLE